MYRRSALATVAVTVSMSAMLAACGGGSTSAGSGSGKPAGPAPGNTSAGGAGGQAQRSGSLPSVSKDATIAATVPASIKKSGTLKIVMSTSSPPAHFTTSSGMSGADADVATLLAKTLGLKPKITGVPLAEILPGMQAKRFDVVVSQFTPTAERAQVLDFVNYGQSGFTLGVLSKSDVTFNTLCGLKLGVQKGSSEAAYVPQLTKKCESKGKKAISMQTYPESSSALLALRSSRIDAVLLDSPVMGYAAKASDGQLKVVKTIRQNPVAVGTIKGNGLIKPLQKALEKLNKEGALDQVWKDWGMGDSAIQKFTINAIQHE